MTHKFYKFSPGLCTCVLGNPYAGSVRINVLKISGTEAVLAETKGFNKDQFVYATLELRDGPSRSLSGVIVSTAATGTLIQWSHSDLREGDRLGSLLQAYEEQIAIDPPQVEAASETEGTEGTEPKETAKESEQDASKPKKSRLVVSDPIKVRSDKDQESDPQEPSAAPFDRSLRKPQETSETGEKSTQDGAKKTAASRAGRSAEGEERAKRLAAELSDATDESDSQKSKKDKKSKGGKREAPKDVESFPSKTRGPGKGNRDPSPLRRSKEGPKNPGTPTADQKKATEQDTASALKAASEPSKVVLRDGKVDIRAKVLRKSKTVRSAELASRVDKVQVLNMSTINSLIKDSVDEAIVLLGPTIGEEERKRLLEEAEEGFQERMEVFKAEKAGLKAQTKTLHEQLQKAQTLLEDEKQKVVSANQFTVSDAGIVELEQKLGRLLERAVKTGKVSDDLEQDMRAVVARLLDDERDKIYEQAQHVHSDRIALLEKKIGRLAGSLDQVGKERDRAQRRAAALEASGGLSLRNVMTAGLDDDDPAKDRKLNLLKEIVDFNRDIRTELKNAGRLPKGRRRAQPHEVTKEPAVVNQESDKTLDATVVASTSDLDEAAVASSLGIKKTEPRDVESAERLDASPDVSPADGAFESTLLDEDTVAIDHLENLSEGG